MTLFAPSGHLTGDALTALARQEPLSELERLELAEHLAYCDHCLHRYTLLLEEQALLSPAADLRAPLMGRIRARTLRLFANRYAAAVAAVVLALTLLWADRLPVISHWESAPAAEVTQPLPERWDGALTSLSGELRALLDAALTLPEGGGRTP